MINFVLACISIDWMETRVWGRTTWHNVTHFLCPFQVKVRHRHLHTELSVHCVIVSIAECNCVSSVNDRDCRCRAMTNWIIGEAIQKMRVKITSELGSHLQTPLLIETLIIAEVKPQKKRESDSRHFKMFNYVRMCVGVESLQFFLGSTRPYIIRHERRNVQSLVPYCMVVCVGQKKLLSHFHLSTLVLFSICSIWHLWHLFPMEPQYIQSIGCLFATMLARLVCMSHSHSQFIFIVTIRLSQLLILFSRLVFFPFFSVSFSNSRPESVSSLIQLRIVVNCNNSNVLKCCLHSTSIYLSISIIYWETNEHLRYE